MKHAEQLADALEAWEKYDKAVCKRAESGEIELDPRGAIAEGVDLDDLYMTAKCKMDAVLEKMRGAR